MNVTNHFLDDLSVKPIQVDPLGLEVFAEAGVTADVLRLDLLHDVVSGNKIFKLKYHLLHAIEQRCTRIATFGGGWSNHIVATAFLCREAGLNSLGFIRGEEPKQLSATLLAARSYGMELRFLSRTEYAERSPKSGFLADDVYTIPAGGGGEAGVLGSMEILSDEMKSAYSHIACSIGTGTMFTGLVCSVAEDQAIFGIPAIKGFTALDPDYEMMINKSGMQANVQVFPDYHFGGFAKKNLTLTDFMNHVYQISGIPTDIVYTGKLFFACADLAKQKHLPPGSRLLIIHSGGLQGNRSLHPEILDF